MMQMQVTVKFKGHYSTKELSFGEAAAGNLKV
jgi:hypothetical protein